MQEYAKFTEDMIKTHTILVPDMLPVHFKLLIAIFEAQGYKLELLQNDSRAVVDEGLKNVHNDACYPALLVIGQFMDALNSGKYDPDKTALLITQTGGGCRASNYIHLLRKALAKTYPQVPVCSLNFSGLEKDSAFRITAPMFMKMLYAVLYGDLMMTCYNKCRAYEVKKGRSLYYLNKWQTILGRIFRTGSKEFLKTKKIYRMILDDFASVELSGEKKVKVGIVGEIYVKYSPLANNHLEDFLISEGCEPVVPSLLEFVMYCAAGTFNDAKIYDHVTKSSIFNKIGYDLIYSKQKELISVMKEHGVFEPLHDFEHLRALADKYINQGVVMGEGWLIPAEMAALAQSGVENIICTQPFGCLPNHIVAKGMSRAIKQDNPNANIVAIDYDPGATRVNQENRIKLMLANARR
ncbi:2-hydroxyacyl-CoA dehydratase [Ruminococcus sp. XPD3002]|uniref:2-hydroxyacyl-CoA dehydratase n=1 Tax=Ruminococcus sp. XPD3002 TaxID=1452269 RepID=UPI00091588B5|nr:2-hydroxyacyl-CoA dehydratase [Ruminococcus sp.]SFX09593.1 Predicted nucleotide-binding protein, sugar kinase/HSP70/actin superfamily [Ruminococcus flavefaciens]